MRKSRLRFLLLSIMLVVIGYISAQNQSNIIEIKGTVVDINNEPVIGASVIGETASNGTVTDLDGTFVIKARLGAEITISYVGCVTQKIRVNERNIHVVLKENSNLLTETVVIGYASMKKKLVTGATLQISGNKLQELHTINPLSALQSLAPGVQITKTSGQPGSGFKVYIRGMGTVGDANPLYIIDNMPGDITTLNPADIESIDVLKDAASSAIYGARAANGVVLITTKRGKTGKARISYDGYYGIQNVLKKPYYLDARASAFLANEGYFNSHGISYDFPNLVPNWDKIVSGEWNGTNWFDEITNKNAPIQSHTMSLSGGTDKSNYFTSFSFSREEGILGKPAVPTNDKFTFRLNTDQVVFTSGGRDIIKIGETVNYTYGRRTGIINDSGRTTNYLSMAMNGSPLMPLHDANGNYHGPIALSPLSPNPIALLDYNSNNEAKSHVLTANGYVTVEPIKGLTYRGSFGMSVTGNSGRKYIPTYNLAPEYQKTEDEITQDMSLGIQRWILENTLNYKLKLKDVHNIDFLVGMSAERGGMGESLYGYNTNSIFSDFDHAYLTNAPSIDATTTRMGGSPWDKTGILSYFGRIIYDYKEKYMLTVLARTDGSSAFAPGKRWGTFPSVSAGWVVSSEDFMKPLDNVINFFKLRASWGQNGNQSIGLYQYLAKIRVGGANAGDYPGVEYSYYYPGIDKNKYTVASYPINIPNPDITWETSEQINIGFDARFLRSRLGVNFDFYNKTTKDWLVAAPTLASFGALSPDINGGNVRNRGIEIGLTWNDNIADFEYDVNVNYAFNRNEVTRINNNERIIHGAIKVPSDQAPEFYRAQVGYPIGYFWGVKTEGIFQNQDEIDNYVNSKGKRIMPNARPGDPIYVNQNDDAVIDDNDRVFIGDPNPDGTFSISLGSRYRNFDFRLSASGVYGNQILGGAHDPFDRWHGEGTSNKWPRLGNTSYPNIISDINIQNGDYLRLNDLTLGYDFSKLFKSQLTQLRVYATVQNLFTLTSYKGLDPEIGHGIDNWSSGIDLGYYPKPRTVLFGISIKL
nr:TonB-dependent receptor [uncultured Bacteroides sp.]